MVSLVGADGKLLAPCAAVRSLCVCACFVFSELCIFILLFSRVRGEWSRICQ